MHYGYTEEFSRLLEKLDSAEGLLFSLLKLQLITKREAEVLHHHIHYTSMDQFKEGNGKFTP